MSLQERRAKNAEKGRKYRLLHADNARAIDKKSKAKRKAANPKDWNAKQRQYQKTDAVRAFHRERNKKRREDNRPKYNAEAREYRRLSPDRLRSHWLRSKYRLTVAEYDLMLESQFGACAICAGPQTFGRRYGVDHDHATGEIRGLLCHYCNSMLGHAKDSPANLRSAAHYLEKRRGAN